ncbi:Protein involved in biosynthesis of mitomycin antibiotics/polyketide fumonisin [Minicystis rosea]|nr:Protein involved in biosynthesis of mitomycin antibiotics/polyketide fumonisin [Minicystis rosea]
MGLVMLGQSPSSSELEALDREGYLVVPDALDATFVQRLRRAFDEAPAQSSGTQHVAIVPETPERDAWRALSRHPALAAAALRVLGPTFHARDVHGRNPLPGFGQQGLHADWPARAADGGYVVLTAIWMLDDFTRDNGATRVVPRTHLLTRAIPKALGQPLVRHPEERTITGRAGTLLAFNGHLWHSGQKNESGAPRRAVQMVVQRGGEEARTPSSFGEAQG